MTSPLPARRTLRLSTPDGVGIAAELSGAEAGRSLLFIHGFSQSGLCWSRQTESPVLAGFRMATYDFRGHGGSDRPRGATFYNEPARWADEVAAVIDACGLDRPVLVGWSYAGRIICDYLGRHGSAGISGIVFVDAAISNERRFYGRCNRLMRQMCSTDPAENIAATRALLRRCFAAPVPQPLFELLFGVNMLVPAEVRAALFGRAADYDDLLSRLDVPVLVVHGEEDEVVAPAMAQHLASLVPGATLDLYAGAGHAPFIEASDRFNSRLAAFVRDARQA
ncbi:alpha/beta hydrolase [Xanthobacter dioxanivorans]|uniref:Alpha/beta hydrolase n=1 Tax=Xanthobacter dioxanivorans TaxID=2528964 RepID=A0A974PKJ4_9HYPH|nr:alpha/beta hydrolase [Xanthobacter dioxanivorans]QRG04879.1 alpha/beta hydrolase [Xanthobacter dioxanivorans]